MQSLTYGTVDIPQITKIIRDYVLSKGKDEEYNLIIGTDSQNFSKTKMVVVIALQHVGHGGFFFYDITNINRISNIKQKLMTETQYSLEAATTLLSEFDKLFDDTDFDYVEQLNFTIHVDAGKNGPTKKVIPEIIEYVRAFGFDATTKPNSFVASTIADRLSK